LLDESGVSFAKAIAEKRFSQVLFVVKNDCAEETIMLMEEAGVIIVTKPINKTLFFNALKMAKAARKQVRRLQTANSDLVRRMEEIQLISRAKCILISYHSMTESEAHRYIEKQAMDIRKTKRAVAEGILKTYEI
jgi:response regulator NasT